MNTRVFKEPLGFIRVIELPLTILAFATTAGYSAVAFINYTCDSKENKLPIDWGYSFDLSSKTVREFLCNNSGKDVYVFGAGAVSQSQFFVLTGVLCFIYILAISVVYVFAWPMYENDKRFALGDFVATAILAAFWFISSCAWASGVSSVKGQTTPDQIMLRLNTAVHPCIGAATTPNCTVHETWNYASLNVSLIAGFACFGLWAANLWFVYKETAWYKARAAPPTSVTGAGPSNVHGTFN